MNLHFILKIIELFKKNLSLELTIRDISKKSGLNYNSTYRTVEDLIKEGVLISKVIGGSRAISLTNSPKTLGFLSISESYNSKSFEELIKKVGEYGKSL